MPISSPVVMLSRPYPRWHRNDFARKANEANVFEIGDSVYSTDDPNREGMVLAVAGRLVDVKLYTGGTELFHSDGLNWINYRKAA